MRAIDTYTPEQMNELKVKGMLADNKAWTPERIAKAIRQTKALDEAQPKAQHSPLPWRVATYENKPPKIIIKGQAGFIAQMGYIDGGDREANARLIVASVNHAGALAEALKDIRDACFDSSIGIETSRIGRIYSVAKAGVEIWEANQMNDFNASKLREHVARTLGFGEAETPTPQGKTPSETDNQQGDMDEYDPLLAAYNNGNGDQTK
jgi:hypothetical protein